MHLVTFSGLDGCGKSTHVSATVDYFARQGLKARPLLTVNLSATGVLLFLRGILRRLNLTLLNQKTARAPSGAKIRVYGKGRSFGEDRRRKVAVFKRWLVYPFDALALRVSLAWLSLRGFRAVVCDRYTFDKLVNLPDVDCALSRIVRWIAPTPDLAVFLDVDPQEARSRREEHDASYYEIKYACYRSIVDLGWGLEAVETSTVESIQRRIELRLQRLMGGPGAAGL